MMWNKLKLNNKRENHTEVNVGQTDTTAILVKMSSDIGYIKARVDKVDEIEKRLEKVEKIVLKDENSV